MCGAGCAGVGSCQRSGVLTCGRGRGRRRGGVGDLWGVFEQVWGVRYGL